MIVVFGGSGFVGSHLIAWLKRNGHTDIISIDRREPYQHLENVTYIQSDVRNLTGLDLPDTIERIYNLAAVHTTPGHPSHEYYETNIAGATEIMAFARRKNVKEIIFTSSISVYGPSEDPKTEDSDPAPQSAYGWSKLLAEQIHRRWAEESGERRLIIVRPAVVFGPRENGNFTRLARLLRGGWLVLPGRASTVKACIYINDLIEFIEAARQSKERFILFNACYPDRYTIGHIVEVFKRDHFPNVRTFIVPQFLMLAGAKLLAPLSRVGLGIHPERILKLARSTDIRPAWLEKNGLARPGALAPALADWSRASENRFV